MNLANLLPLARRVFRESLGHDVELVNPVVLKQGTRSLVLRCEVKSGQAAPSSVIVKHVASDAVRGFSDWASLEFLGSIPAARDIVPRFYGGDVSHSLFLIEDLGEAYSLDEIFAQGDATVARSALRGLARQMARLHLATRGRESEYEAIRASLPGHVERGRQGEAEHWLGQREKLKHWFGALDCVVAADFERALESVSEFYRHGNGFLAFTHGDPAPSNNHVHQGRAYLLDFEYGGYRHALYDLTAWYVLCPLPLHCVDEMIGCFRDEFSHNSAWDEDEFARGWIYLCAYRALAILTWVPLDVLNENRAWAGDWSMREAVLTSLSRLVSVTAPIAELEMISEAASGLHSALLSRWPEYEIEEELIPRWSAFTDC